MKKIRTIFTVSLLFAALTVAADGTPEKSPSGENDNALSWNLSDIYSDWDAWQADFDHAMELMQKVESYKGKIKSSDEKLVELLELEDELGKTFAKVYRYPAFMRDLNSRNQEVAGRMQQLMAVFAKYGTATSWISPEILSVPKSTMEQWIDANPELEPYAFNLMNQFRLQEHVYNEDKEKMLSYFSQISRTASSIYDELSVSDIQFPTVTLSDGEEVTLTHGNYSKLLETNKNQEDRKLIFHSYMKMYKEMENTYAAIYKGICDKNYAWAQARGYESTLAAKLEGNSIPESVYTSLIKTAYDNVDPLQRYLKLRKKIMGLEELHTYDLSTKLVDFEKEYDFNEAVGIIKNAVEPLGKDYVERIDEATQGGWIDVYEKDNKTSGAYSANVYGVHPYILMNWNGSLNHTFTLAHELGHSMHSIYSNKNQPYPTHSYTIFVAEVASTFNEHLLLQKMVAEADSPQERITLLQQAIENIWSTFYVQSLFADYEYRVHKLVETGQPVTASVLSGIMHELYTHYYGDAVTRDEIGDVKWARIPHFFGMPYYVYQYATSFSASSQIFKNVTEGSQKERKEAMMAYKELLKSGGNDFPVNQLQKAGVDLTTSKPFEAVVAQMNDLVTQLEKELEQL
ncbi:MAG: oligoendopeptidase F [Salinivirgaceae bacterium]|jgi:oligoendopeptidase F|nr:oligoendopeptidase F [Salinivirgaceae bacterium]